MPTGYKSGKLLFIDDEEGAVKPYIAHLRDEGFTNIVHMTNVATLNEVLQHAPDLVFLDIAGVGSTLDPKDEGLAILKYIKKQTPWTRVVILSGSQFRADKAPDLASADVCVTKASLNLAALVNLTEEQLKKALAPEYRNVRISSILLDNIDDLRIGWFSKWRLRRLVTEAMSHEGDPSFDWVGLAKKLTTILKTTEGALSIVKALGVFGHG